jgi:hypothetical protein
MKEVMIHSSARDYYTSKQDIPDVIIAGSLVHYEHGYARAGVLLF